MLPFKETQLDSNNYVRTFSEDVESGELMWHRDREDREILSKQKSNWMIQLEDELPKRIPTKEPLKIPMGVWHRLIKGTSDLVLLIKKHNELSH